MIWSARKQYYLGFWAILELKLVNILIKTRVWTRVLGNFKYGGDHAKRTKQSQFLLILNFSTLTNY